MSKKLLVCASLAAIGFAAKAQDSLKTKVLDEVVVTATKTEQKQSTTGKMVTVITKATIEKSTGKTVAQLLNEQAGITINSAYNNLGSVQSVFMRGSNVGRTLILIDGIPQNDPSFINTEYDLNFFNLNDIERIEVCRGAQSTLYGSDAIAGVINIITINKNTTKPFNIKATATGGSKNTYKGNLQLFGKADKFLYQVRYAHLNSKGFSAAYDSAANKDFDRDGYIGHVASASVIYQATNKFSVRTFAQYSRYKAAIDASGFVDERDYNITNKVFTAGAGFQYKADAVTLTGNYQYSDLSRNYLNDSGFVAGFSSFERNEYKGKTQFAELYASINLGSGFTLLQGGDYRRGNMSNDYLSISMFGPYTSQFKDTALSQASIYSSLQYNYKKFYVELGGRINVHSRYGNNETYTFNPGYNFNEHYRVFGSVATGFKAPSLYQLYAGGGTGNADLKPEESKNYEIGVQQQHNKISNRIVFFYRDIDNGVDYDNQQFTYFNYINQIVRGIEYELNAKPTEKLNITANYTFISSDEKTQSRITQKDSSYNYLLRRPKHQININAGYQFTKALYASTGGKYVSKRFDVGGYQVADVSLDSYVILNAYAEYKLEKYFTFFADVQNIIGKKFYDIRGYNAIPCMFNAGITFRY